VQRKRPHHDAQADLQVSRNLQHGPGVELGRQRGPLQVAGLPAASAPSGDLRLRRADRKLNRPGRDPHLRARRARVDLRVHQTQQRLNRRNRHLARRRLEEIDRGTDARAGALLAAKRSVFETPEHRVQTECREDQRADRRHQGLQRLVHPVDAALRRRKHLQRAQQTSAGGDRGRRTVQQVRVERQRGEPALAVRAG